MKKILLKKIEKIIEFEKKRDISSERKWNKDMQIGYMKALEMMKNEMITL
jgi:hypothetical protein